MYILFALVGIFSTLSCFAQPNDAVITQISSISLDAPESELLSAWSSVRNAITQSPSRSRDFMISLALKRFLNELHEEQKIEFSLAPLRDFFIDGGAAALVLRAALSCSNTNSLCVMVPAAVTEPSSIVHVLGKGLVGLFAAMGGLSALHGYWHAKPSPRRQALDTIAYEVETLIQRIDQARSCP